MVGLTVKTSPSFTFGLGPPVSRPFRNGPSRAERPFDMAHDDVGFVGTVDAGATVVSNRVIHVVLNWDQELLERVPIP